MGYIKTTLDENNAETFVTCNICNRKLVFISKMHLATHGVTKDDYLKTYNLKLCDISSIAYKRNSTITLENAIKKYGIEEGTKKFEVYKQKQASKNTFEHKNAKYGWTKEQFDAYNKTRACTLDNFVQRHGEQGQTLWSEYCDLQKYAGTSVEYFIDNYGEIEGRQKYKEVCSKKRHTLENYVSKYGEVIGHQKWMQHNINVSNRYSNVSAELFAAIDTKGSEFTFYNPKNREYFMWSDSGDSKVLMWLDYYDLSQKKAIEFFGDYWHANPSKYAHDFYNAKQKMTAAQIWERDKQRIKALEEKGIKLLIIWEKDYNDNKQLIIDQCKQFLYEV